ncbi:hypothetical protein D3C72_1584130 [compost metagenome]
MWGSDLIFNCSNFCFLQDRKACFILHYLYGSNIESDTGVKFKCSSSRRGLRISEHNSDLFTNLVNVDPDNTCAANGACSHTHGLGHDSSKLPYMGISNFTVQLSLCNQGSY